MTDVGETRPASKDRLAGVLTWARALLSLFMSPVGAFLSLQSLGIHERASGHMWQSSRYFMENRGWTWQIVDFLLSIALGGILFPRLTWLVMSIFARVIGRKLPLSKVVWWLDLFWLVIPGALLAYLIYAANH